MALGCLKGSDGKALIGHLLVVESGARSVSPVHFFKQRSSGTVAAATEAQDDKSIERDCGFARDGFHLAAAWLRVGGCNE